MVPGPGKDSWQGAPVSCQCIAAAAPIGASTLLEAAGAALVRIPLMLLPVLAIVLGQPGGNINLKSARWAFRYIVHALTCDIG
jgi:hypothetical protein